MHSFLAKDLLKKLLTLCTLITITTTHHLVHLIVIHSDCCLLVVVQPWRLVTAFLYCHCLILLVSDAASYHHLLFWRILGPVLFWTGSLLGFYIIPFLGTQVLGAWRVLQLSLKSGILDSLYLHFNQRLTASMVMLVYNRSWNQSSDRFLVFLVASQNWGLLTVGLCTRRAMVLIKFEHPLAGCADPCWT